MIVNSKHIIFAASCGGQLRTGLGGVRKTIGHSPVSFLRSKNDFQTTVGEDIILPPRNGFSRVSVNGTMLDAVRVRPMFRVKSGDTAREDDILPYSRASIFFCFSYLLKAQDGVK